MKFKIVKTVFFLSITFSIFSCKAPIDTVNKKKSSNTFAIGESTSDLDDNIWDIFQDQKGHYWFGSNGNGVILFDGTHLTRYTTKDGLIDNSIRGIQGDHLGNVYIETPSGISKYDGKVFETLKPIISPTNKWMLEPNDLWFNCNGNPNDAYRFDGVNLYELTLPRMDLNEAFGVEVKGLSFRDMNHSPYSVFGINKDKAGNLWIGTVVAGAFRYDGKSFLWVAEKELSTLPDGRVPGVRSMLEDKNGYIWLSNFKSKYRIIENDSIAKYERLEGISESSGYFEDRIPYFNSGLIDKKENLWMTTYGGGAWKYDGKQLYNFPITTGDSDVLLVSIYEDSQGILWLGTDNDGVYKYNGEDFIKFMPNVK